MIGKRRAVSNIVSTVIILLIVSVTGGYLYTYSTEYFQKENNRFMDENQLRIDQKKELFKIVNIWDKNDFLNLTIYNYGDIEVTISDVYVDGIRVNKYMFGRYIEIYFNQLHEIGFYSPIELSENQVYEIKVVTTRGIMNHDYWVSNYTG
jgi:archaellum component FlaF (FlaF/FlaG flagellin family)